MINTDLYFYKELTELISTNVLSDKSKVKEFYSDWKINYGNEKNPYLSDVINKSLVSEKQFLPQNSTTVGIDLPTWFGNIDQKRIFFLGIDPMRNASEFLKNGVADITNEVIVGTPYAFHHSDFRTKRTKSYWEIIDNLHPDNFIYVTDIFKTFFYSGEKVRSYKYFMSKDREDERKSHSNLLKCEIELIKPDLIVTFGRLSYKLLMDIKYPPKLSQPINQFNAKLGKIPVLPLMHLSGSTREIHLKSFFKENNIIWEERDGRQKAAKHYAKLISNIL